MKINPCRYCGFGPTEDLGPYYRLVDRQVSCNCGCSGPYAPISADDAPKAAITGWNSLNPPKEQTECK